MRVTIVGAGIGGLSVAIALKKNGHDVTVYERASEIRPVGAALSIWANGIKCLNYLGLRDEIAEIGGQQNSMAYINGLDGTTMTQFSLLPLHNLVGQRSYPISRAQLQAVLIEKLGPENLKLGMCVKTVSQTNETVVASFEDDTQVESDLLIGSDGAHSAVRAYILGHQIERRYSGYVNYNGLVSMKHKKNQSLLAPADQWTTFVGEGKRASLMPVSGERFYFFLDVPVPIGLENNRTKYKEELHKNFQGWVQPVHDIIDSIDVNSTNRVEIHDIDPLMKWTKGRVTLIGDAAHNATPDLGQGGCLALEDAVVLSWCLEAHDIDLEESLKRFATLRAERCSELTMRARKRCDVTHAIDAEENRAWYENLTSETGQCIISAISKTILGGPFS